MKIMDRMKFRFRVSYYYPAQRTTTTTKAKPKMSAYKQLTIYFNMAKPSEKYFTHSKQCHTNLRETKKKKKWCVFGFVVFAMVLLMKFQYRHVAKILTRTILVKLNVIGNSP